MAVVGMKEMENDTLAMRSRKLGDLGSFAVNDLIDELVSCNEQAIEMSTMGVVEAKE